MVQCAALLTRLRERAAECRDMLEAMKTEGRWSCGLRFELWHIKDVFGLKKVNPSLGPNARVSSMTFVPVRVGHIDFKPVFANAALAGLKHFVIEQDNASTWGDSLSAARISYQDLRRLLS